VTQRLGTDICVVCCRCNSLANSKAYNLNQDFLAYIFTYNTIKNQSDRLVDKAQQMELDRPHFVQGTRPGNQGNMGWNPGGAQLLTT
jgi:hypothetical protein